MNKVSLPVFLELSASGAFETKWYFLQTEAKQESYCAFLGHALEPSEQEPREAILGNALTGLCGFDLENTYSLFSEWPVSLWVYLCG